MIAGRLHLVDVTEGLEEEDDIGVELLSALCRERVALVLVHIDEGFLFEKFEDRIDRTRAWTGSFALEKLGRKLCAGHGLLAQEPKDNK